MGSWFSSLLARGGPQTKKLAYLWVILCTTIWLTIGIWRPFTTEWNVALGLLLTAVTTGYVGGKKVGATAPTSPEGHVPGSRGGGGAL